MNTYKCPKCETEFTSGTKFCENCGCNLEVEFIETPTCPKCGKTFPTGTKFCNEHGTKLASPEQLIPRCNKCKKEYTDGTKFCPDCGGSVGVSALLTNRSLSSSSANDILKTMPNDVSGFIEKFGVLTGTVGVVLFSLFNWIQIPMLGGTTLFGVRRILNSLLNSRDFRMFVEDVPEIATARGLIVILIIALLLSFVLLITSLVKPQLKAKSVLAYSGFGLSAIVAAVFIIVAMIAQAELRAEIGMSVSILTAFPFLTLAVAVLSMIFAVKRPTKDDFKDAISELKGEQ